MPDKFLLLEDVLLLASFKITPLQIIILTPEVGSAVLTAKRELRETAMTARSLTQAGRNQASTKDTDIATVLPLAAFSPPRCQFRMN